jgi:2-oxoisovalerate dehydrogenase E1 component
MSVSQKKRLILLLESYCDLKMLDKDMLKYLTLLREALFIRKVEEKLLDLFAKGKLNGTVHTCIGQELNAVAIAQCLKVEDHVFSNHRGHGHYLARTKDGFGLMAELMGRTGGASGGYGGSQHLFNKNFYSNGIQGGMTPIAAGLALSLKLKASSGIVVSFIGDGTLGEGILYEAFNMASVWAVPVLYVLENNGIAQSTSSKQTFSGSIQQRAEGFGLSYFFADGQKMEDLVEVSNRAVSFVRENQRPVLLEIKSARLHSHSKGDDNRLVDDVDELKKNDLINTFVKHYNEADAICKAIELEIDTLVKHVEESSVLEQVANEKLIQTKPLQWVKSAVNRVGKISELIYQALNQRLAQEDSILIGEDIQHTSRFNPKPYGGAFKVTKNLSELYPLRVRNTPISEGAMVGFGTGLALGGLQAMVEIMFGDFATLTFDQLYQHATKFNAMSNNQVHVPLLVRTPMGGRRGYGPTHSQSIEKHFLGIPGLTVIALNSRIDPGILYGSIFTLNSPCLVVENKVLYTRDLKIDALAGFEIHQTQELFPTIRIAPQTKKAQVTILCYGEMLDEVEAAIEQAFDDEEILAEVVCFSCLQPVNAFPILESVRKTGKLITVEEGSSYSSFSSEIVSYIVEQGIMINKLTRIGNETIIPCSLPAELNLIANRKSIVKAIKELAA